MRKNVQKRRAKFKLRVGLDAIKGQKTINEIASEYEVHPSLISKWKKQIIEQGDEIFKSGYYRPDPALAAQAVRPSATFNEA